MNILGVGGWEFLLIMLIMVVVAGPRRMAHWAYLMGRYTARLRTIWAETMEILQKEFDEAGLDVKLPKEPPTRQNIQAMSRNYLKPITQPMEDAMKEVEAEMKEDLEIVNETNDLFNGNGHKKTSETVQTTPPEDKNTPDDSSDFGSWSNTDLSN